MKVWQKIYLMVLMVSIIFVNIGIFAVFQITYQKNIEEEQIRAGIDYNVISSAIENNFTALKEQKRLNEKTRKSLMELFEKDYTAQKMRINLWNEEKSEYGITKTLPYKIKKGQKVEIISGKRGEKEVTVLSYLKDHDQYVLGIRYPLKELNDMWRSLNKVYLWISFGVSVVLAVVLSILLGVLLYPLSRLSGQVDEIRKGNYKKRMKVRGNDELSVLGKNINEMAQTIEMQIEKLKNENIKKQQFIDDLSHEMKSPLTCIYGYAEYISKADVSSEELFELCEIIMDESNRIKTLSKNLMELSEFQHTKPEMEKFYIQDFLEHMKKIVENRTQKDHSMIKIDILWKNHIQGNDEFFGNKELLEMLILNLISNGKRACHRKFVEKKEEKCEEDKLFVEVNVDCVNKITVSDNGSGISAEQISHIVEPFYRVDKGRSRKEGGNGLGLALCKQIVEVHQGKMDFLSEPGKGTVVIVNLWCKETGKNL